MFEALLTLAMLTVADPSGDAQGDGSLRGPTAPVYRTLAPFDLRSVTVTDDPLLTVVIEMGSLANPFELPQGFSMPVIEVYLEGEEGTGVELLPGSGMRLPEGRTWETALRLTGEQALAYRSTGDGFESVTPQVEVDGNQLTVSLPIERPQRRPRIYAMTGLYDLFGSTPWRPLSEVESPWAFSSSQSQTLPVVDILASDEAAQRQALETGVIPAAGGRRLAEGAVWLVLMALGLSLALVGVALRILGRRAAVPEQPSQEPAITAAPVPEQAGGDEDSPEEWIGEPGPAQTASAGAAVDDPLWAQAADDYVWGQASPEDLDDEPLILEGSQVLSSGPTEVASGEGWGEGELAAPKRSWRVLDTAPKGHSGEKEPAASPGDSAVRQGSGERRELRRFLWDSSALLTELEDANASDDEVAREFSGAESGTRREVWDRPVPLPLEVAGSAAQGADPDEDPEDDVVLLSDEADEEHAEEDLGEYVEEPEDTGADDAQADSRRTADE